MGLSCHGKLIEGIAPSHSGVIPLKISWAETRPAELRVMKVLGVKEESSDEEVIGTEKEKSYVMRERDEKVRGVEEQFNDLKDLL